MPPLRHLLMMCDDAAVGPVPWLPALDEGAGGGGGGGPAGGDSQGAGEGVSPDGGEGVASDQDWRVEAEKWRALSRKHEARAKANAAAAARVAELEAASLSETERARAEAVAAARVAARDEVLPDLIAARFEAEALRAGRDAARVGDLLEDLDLARFRAEDGSVDVERIRARVGLLPAVEQPAPRVGVTGQGGGAPPPQPAGSAGLAEAQRRYGSRT